MQEHIKYRVMILINLKKFLIDGFPRGIDQAILLENKMSEIDFVLDYRCP